MTNILSAPWKLATGGASLVCLILLGFLVSANIQNHQLAKANTKLDLSINDPNTGYVIRLAQQRTNAATVEAGLTRQNTALKQRADDAEAKLAVTTAALAKAQAHTAEVQRQVRDFMAVKPRGSTLEQRVNDVDRRFLEMLK